MLRPETPEDIPAIHSLLGACFPTALEGDLVDNLRAAGDLWLSLVKEEAGQVVGHVAFSPVEVEGSAGGQGVGLGPLAVLEGWRRRGIGAELVREGLARCRAQGWAFVVVLGDPAYYSRFGFRAAREWGLRDEYGGGDAFQALELCPEALDGARGLVRYAPAFPHPGSRK